jgi:hypothetical protein
VKLTGIFASITSSALFLADTVLAARPYTIDLQPMAVLPYGPNGEVVCSDADLDAKTEVYLQPRLREYYALEYEAKDSFTPYRIPNEGANLFWTVGDADRDGNTELIQQRPQYLTVRESVHPDTLPTQVIWSRWFEYQADMMRAQITDLDRDSALEVAALYTEKYGVALFEHVVNDSFGHVATVRDPSLKSTAMCFHETGDLDRDGRPELFAAASDDVFVLYEAVADNSFGCTVTCTTATYLAFF